MALDTINPIEKERVPKTIFVNRNEGAKEWAKQNGLEDAEIVESFSLDMVEKGDTIVGTLPLSLAAGVHEKGADFRALTMNPFPKELRGVPLSAEQMDELEAKVQKMRVEVEEVVPTKETICVTRHAGAKEWLKRHDIDADVKPQFTESDMESVNEDTTVIGVLPPTMVAEINERGGRFVSLDVRVPSELFKTEISADKMEELGAKMTGYRVSLN